MNTFFKNCVCIRMQVFECINLFLKLKIIDYAFEIETINRHSPSGCSQFKDGKLR